MSVHQSPRTCDWTFSFSDSGRQISRLRFSEKGNLLEEIKLTMAK